MTTDRTTDAIDEAIALLDDIVKLRRHPLIAGSGMFDVPLGQVRAMGFLHSRRRCTIGELAAGIGVSLPSASEMVDRLVDGGWVERGINPEDRRQTHVWLTPRAHEVGECVKTARRGQMESAFSRLSARDREAFLRGLRVVAEALEAPVVFDPPASPS